MPHKSPTSPSRVQSSTKSARARRLLTRGQLSRADSDDELGFEDHPWQWVYEKNELSTAGRNGTGDSSGDQTEDDAATLTSRRRTKPLQLTSRSHDQEIIGAKMGSFECKIGDCVLLKAEGDGNRAWVGIICEFGEDENDEMSAHVMCRCRWSGLQATCLQYIGFSSEQEIRNKHKKRSDFLIVSLERPIRRERMLMLLE